MINTVSKSAKHHHDFGQLADGYLKKTPIFQFVVVSLMFPLWGTAASLNDILITQFKKMLIQKRIKLMEEVLHEV